MQKSGFQKKTGEGLLNRFIYKKFYQKNLYLFQIMCLQNILLIFHLKIQENIHIVVGSKVNKRLSELRLSVSN